MNRQEVEEILAQCHAPFDSDPLWCWRVMEKGDGFLVQLVFDAPDIDEPGTLKENHGRKWYVSSHCTETEVVGTALAAYERAVLHEARERFRYKGRQVADPHFHVDGLVALADAGRRDSR